MKNVEAVRKWVIYDFSWSKLNVGGKMIILLNGEMVIIHSSCAQDQVTDIIGICYLIAIIQFETYRLAHINR